MKRILRIVAAALVAVTLVFPLTACAKKKLAAPTGLDVNYDYVFTWSAIEDARRYEIKVTETSTQTEKPLVSSNKASYDFSALTAGVYRIAVRAVAGDNKHADSDWSESLEFTRDPETGCTYKLINNGSAYEITRCSTAVTDTIEIEDIYRGKPVISIAKDAFKGSRAEVIIVGKNVKTIKENAFYGATRLKKVVLPEKLTVLGEKAFQGCKVLEEVNIPESITELKDGTFAYCTALPQIRLHNKLTKIGYGAFQSCKALTSVEIPDSVTAIGDYAFNYNDHLASVKIGSGVVSIGEFAFYGCSSLKNIEFAENSNVTTFGKSSFALTGFTAFNVPQGVTDIGDNCFDSASALESVTIADTVTHVGYNAFYRTKLYDDAIDYETLKPKDTSKDEVFLYADKWLIAYANGVQQKDDKGNVVSGGLARLNDTNVKSDTVGIADYAFARISTLKNVTATNLKDLKYIGDHAFERCGELQRVTIPYAVEIGQYAFYKCVALIKADFTYNINGRSNLKKIGAYAFYDCTDMGAENNANVTVPSSVDSIGASAFKNTAFWESASKNEGVVYVGTWIVGYTTLEKGNVSIKNEGTVGIADYAFYKCSALLSIDLSNIKYIGRGAFSGCTGFQTVILGPDVTEVKPYTFYNCEQLYSADFSDAIDLTSIGDHAFYGCSRLLKVDFSSNVALESIGDYAFYACSNLGKNGGTDKNGNKIGLTLGKNLKTIGNYAFSNRNTVVNVDGKQTIIPERANTSLEEIIIPDSVTYIGDNAFAYYSNVTSIKIGSNVKHIGAYAFKNCTALKEINVPSGITSIGKSVFYKDAAVEKVNLGNDIDEIGDYAFYGMEKVERLILPQGVTSIGRYAFLRWKAVKSVVISKEITVIGDHAFNACNSATFYTDAPSIMPEWSKNWNSSYRPVVWNCALSEDKTYVVSVTMSENGILNPLAKGGISAPERDGYKFKGWTTEENSTDVEFSAEELTLVEKGVTVYAVWEKAE